MKRIFVALALFFVATPAIAATLSSNVRYTIEKALANEREAVARYEAFAVKADADGYPGAAALFRAQARSEGVHAARFEKLLRENGVPVPEAKAVAVTPGDTAENLRASASAETAERDGIYHDAIETARADSADAIAKLFDQTRDSEVEHANLCMAAARNLHSMKEPKTYYVCPHCGYTTEFSLPFCAVCRSREGSDAVR